MFKFKKESKGKNFKDFTLFDFVTSYCVKYDKHRTTVINLLINKGFNMSQDNLKTEEINQIERFIKLIVINEKNFKNEIII